MAGLGSNHFTTTTAASHIPEIWMDEVQAFLRAKLVAAKRVKNYNIKGKVGDTFHIPHISEMSTNDKAANTAVTLQTFTDTKTSISINKHKESSFVIEDIVRIQQVGDLRREYTKSAGYAIAKQIDTDILGLGAGLSKAVAGDDGTTAWNASGAGNGADMTDAGIRAAIEYLDTNDVDDDNRSLIIHPSQKNVLLGINRFTEQAYYGTGSPISTGEFGEIYGVKVYPTTQIPSVTAGDGSTTYYRNLLIQKEAFAVAIQLAPRVQMENRIDYLGTLVVVDTVYGVVEYRDVAGVAIYTPS